MKKVSLLFTLLLTALFADFYDNDWIDKGQMLRYPASKYFYAVGSGSTREGANTSAIVEVRKQISSTVKTSQLVSEDDVIENGNRNYTSKYNERTKISMQGEVSGINILASAEKDGVHYAFAVLKKEDFVKNSRANIQELKALLEKVFNDAKSKVSSGDITGGLTKLAEASKIFDRLKSTRMLLTAAATLTDKEAYTITESDISEQYAQCLNSLQTKIVSGNKQVVKAGIIPEEPFEVKISSAGFPVPYIPFKLVTKTGKKIMEGYSDRDGIVSFYLSENANTEKGKHYYTVEPSLRVAKAHRSKLKMLSQNFVYKVEGAPVYANIKVEVGGKLASKRGSLAKKTRALLAKYDVQDDSCKCMFLVATITATEGEYIQGVSRERTFLKSKVDILFTLKDKNGKTLDSFSKSGSGMGNDFASSVMKGIESVKIKDGIMAMKEKLKEVPVVAKKAAPVKKPKIIVFPFKNTEYIANWHDLSQALSGMITTKLINSGEVIILERQEIAKLVDEKMFRGEDIDLAKFVGADLAIFGTASLSGGKIEVDARLVDVKTAVSKTATSATGYSLRDLRSIANRLVSNITINGKKLGAPKVQPKVKCCRR